MPFLIAAVLAGALGPVAIALGRATGLLDRPGHELKIHAEPVSVLGGVAVAVAAIVALTVDGVHLPAALLLTLLLAVWVGLVDDVRDLSTRWHLALQATAAAILLLAFDWGTLPALGLVAAVLVCTNAVNLLDGQDGLAAGVAAIGALGLAAVAAGDPGLGGELALALAGALCGFLLWNRPPARLYLGNGGAYAAAALLAVSAALALEGADASRVLAVAVCLGGVAFDLCFTVARRLRTGSLATGDRLHSYDLLAAHLGLARSTLALWGIAAIGAAAAVAIDSLPLPAGIVLAAIVCGAAVAAGLRLGGLLTAQRTGRSGSAEPSRAVAVSARPSSSDTRGS